MFDSTIQNPNCGFSDEIVSYVYNEIDDSEKALLEKHLADCRMCFDEVNAFSSISFSMQEWKDEEFSRLASPQIEIPYQLEKVVKTEDVSKSFLQITREIFSFSPAFFKTATAFGTMAIVFGLGLFFFGSSLNKVNEVAGKDEQLIEKSVNSDDNSQPLPAKVDEIAEVESVSEPVRNLPDENEKVVRGVAAQTSLENRKPFTNKGENIRVKQSKNIKPIKKVSDKTKNSNKIKPEPTEIQEVPRLTDFAVETDESDDIRLSDIFAEIETDR